MRREGGEEEHLSLSIVLVVEEGKGKKGILQRASLCRRIILIKEYCEGWKGRTLSPMETLYLL